MDKNERLKLFTFLEKKKEDTYKIQNKYPSNKTAIAKIELLKEIYEYFGFNFVSTAFLREREEKYYKSLIRVFKDEKEGMKLIIESLKHHYRRLRKYDVLKVGKATYPLNIKRKVRTNTGQ